MLPFKLVYHEGYDLRLGQHVFQSQKFRMVRDLLLADHIAEPSDILAPEPATDEDILRVHTREWVDKCLHDKLTLSERMRLEIPYSEAAVKGFWLAAGGSILAAHCAAKEGFGINIGGGFHHAFPGHGEGFCMIHDVAVAIRRLQSEGALRRVLIVDTDVHQGNGTAAIFAGDADVFTLSLHQENNYPEPKPPSDLDVNLADGVGDEEYLELLDKALASAFRRFAPEMIFYIGGADPYREDQLGGLRLSMRGLQERDALVFAEARLRGLPVAVAFAGGYARNVEDTVRIHVNTIIAAREASAAHVS
ncbi:MAG TPA: histone deacetylase [Candidatus Acidoferrales bacterium]|jgi:acetoin utilization deacetylase AcuC-like enzyme|nr:histone deacetylase [Candidatus Acidoferrales bacterium]